MRRDFCRQKLRRAISAAAAGIVSTCAVQAANSQTIASWVDGDIAGSWNEVTRWSTNPYYPNNGNPSGTTYDAVINTPTFSFVSLNSAVTINSLTVDSSSLFRLGKTGVLDAKTITFNAGSFNPLAGAEIHNATLRSGTTRAFYFSENVLNAVTIGSSAHLWRIWHNA